MGQPVRKRYDIQIATEKQLVSQTFNLDKNIKVITGVMMSSSRDDLLYYRGAQRIEINGREYFPDNYESKLLMSGLNITPKNRFYDLGAIPTGNGIVKLTYQDSETTMTTFEPYRVSIYLVGELDDEI